MAALFRFSSVVEGEGGGGAGPCQMSGQIIEVPRESAVGIPRRREDRWRVMIKGDDNGLLGVRLVAWCVLGVVAVAREDTVTRRA